MRKSLLIPLMLLAWPMLEIAGFIIVGREIGLLATLGLIILSGILGVLLLRIQGFSQIDRIRNDLDAGRVPAESLVSGLMLLVAGVLLLLPGFVSDIAGLLLFIPAVRSALWRALGARVSVVVSERGRGFGARRPASDAVIDLAPEDYSERADATSPWRKPGTGELPDR